MEILIGLGVLILLAFIIGLGNREKGDGFTDTVGHGCQTIIGFIMVVAIIIACIHFCN